MKICHFFYILCFSLPVGGDVEQSETEGVMNKTQQTLCAY
jgi:hypothetical protein